MADTLNFPDTPVKQITVDGTWKDYNAKTIDESKGKAYWSENSSDQLSVKEIQKPVSESVRKIFGTPGKLSAQQLSLLAGRDNPWILRYCGERGNPEVVKVNNRNLLLTDFFQEEIIRVRSKDGQGSMCMPAGKYEAHAFALNGDKLVHIFLRNTVRNEEKMDAKVQMLSEKFRRILATAQWQ